ncbi:MAG: hypothetical protein ABIN79_12380 [Marmoricola sp.]
MSDVAQVENPFAGQGAVLLDIGGDVGALVVTMPAEMLDIEVEIRPEGSGNGDGDGQHGHDHSHSHDHGHHAEHGHDHGGEHHHPHVAVVARPVQGETVPSLVYPELVEGRYELYVKETSEIRLRVEIKGGEVTTVEWPR